MVWGQYNRSKDKDAKINVLKGRKYVYRYGYVCIDMDIGHDMFEKMRALTRRHDKNYKCK